MTLFQHILASKINQFWMLPAKLFAAFFFGNQSLTLLSIIKNSHSRIVPSISRDNLRLSSANVDFLIEIGFSVWNVTSSQAAMDWFGSSCISMVWKSKMKKKRRVRERERREKRPKPRIPFLREGWNHFLPDTRLRKRVNLSYYKSMLPFDREEKRKKVSARVVAEKRFCAM